MTTSQEGIYFDQMATPQSPCYNVGSNIIIKGELDVALLSEALNKTVCQLDMLTADFEFCKGVPIQHIGTYSDFPLEYIDLRGENQAVESAEKIIHDELNMIFKIGEQRLLKSSVIRLSTHEYWWVTSMHHLITDAIGYLFFLQVVENIYHKLKAGE